MEKEKIQKDFEKIARQIQGLSKEIERFVPYAIIKETVAFGNSSHVVLSKSFLDKRVGVIILGDKEAGR
jgi:putative transposon-encoded protein